jgi:uncharacterized protein YfdQ (DUF2303 family)
MTTKAIRPDILVDSHPTSAFDAALKAAMLSNPEIHGNHGHRAIILPEGYKLHDVSDPYALPPHIIKTHVTVDTRASLSAYVNRFAQRETILIADYDAGTVKAILDWHKDSLDDGEPLAPMPREHTCTLKLRPSEEFKRWAAFENKFHEQAEFAAFLEENAVDVVDPEPAVFIEISRDLEGTQGVTFKSSTRLENGDRAFNYEKETRAKGDIKIPREFTLSIPLYDGEDPVALRCAFRWQINAGALQMGFVWRRVEYQRRAYFAELATKAAEETGQPVFFGRVA